MWLIVVAKIDDFIRSTGLNNRQFQQFLNNMETEKADIIYYIFILKYAS